jgi:hypothetical protein
MQSRESRCRGKLRVEEPDIGETEEPAPRPWTSGDYNVYPWTVRLTLDVSGEYAILGGQLWNENQLDYLI